MRDNNPDEAHDKAFTSNETYNQYCEISNSELWYRNEIEESPQNKRFSATYH